MTDREAYEAMRDELIRSNQKLHNREQTAVTFLRGRSAALVELGKVRHALAAAEKRASKAERERDNARKELQRVCAGAGFKIPVGEAS